MKHVTQFVLASLLIGVLSLGSSAHARRTERVIKADIPFDFTVGTQVFPAGDYRLVRVEPWLLELRDHDGTLLANVLTQAVQSSSSPSLPKLRFDLEGGRHILTQVWQENDSVGQELLQTKSASRAVQKRSGHVQTAKVGNLQ